MTQIRLCNISFPVLLLFHFIVFLPLLSLSASLGGNLNHGGMLSEMQGVLVELFTAALMLCLIKPLYQVKNLVPTFTAKPVAD